MKSLNFFISGRKITRSLSPVAAWALSFGCATGWGAFMMPGTTFLPLAGPIGTAAGILIGGLIMLLIGINYHYMINHYPDAGGTFSFLGHDHGFLCAWFLVLVYVSIAWANATALPLIFRYLFGDTFQFGFHYRIAGYEVYFSEAILSIAAIWLFCYICSRGSKLTGMIQLICAVVLIFGIAIGFLAATSKGMSFSPAFAPSKKPLTGVLSIISLSPWAFVGFESISHAAEEYNFPARKIFRIILAAVIASSLCYIALTWIAVSVQPEGYSNWAEYIADLDNLQGTAAAPVFYAINSLLGKPGIAIFCLTLLGAVFTGILGNSFALSRLMLSMSREHMLPRWMGKQGGEDIPRNILPFLMVISIPIPFLGRSVIGWIIDINTICAAIAYMYTSIATLKTADEEGNRFFKVTGITGIVCSIFFVLYYMVPNFSAVTTLGTESYLILVVWSILGFLFFRHIFRKDDMWRFGNSTVVWIALLFLIFFTTTLWTRQASHQTTKEVITDLAEHHKEELRQYGIEENDKDKKKQKATSQSRWKR